MGIEQKHEYRFVYLKSEEWELVRSEALAKCDAVCAVCGYRDLSNDAHHFHYPANFRDTTVKDLIVLCRTCHELFHALEEAGILRFSGDFKLCKITTKMAVIALKQWAHQINMLEMERSFCTSRRLKASIKEVRAAAQIKICMGCGKEKDSTMPRRYWIAYNGKPTENFRVCEECNEYVMKAVPWSDIDWGTSGAGLFYRVLRLMSKGCREVSFSRQLKDGIKPKTHALGQSSNTNNSPSDQ